MSEPVKSAEVVIIGGGVIGLAVARSLALRGVRDVLLIERGSLGAEASSAAAGMLAPQAEANRAHEFFYFSCQSRDMYPAFAAALQEETGIDIELDRTGTLYLAFTDEDVHEIERRHEWQSEAGLPIEKLSADDARNFEPAINESVRSALRFPLDTQVENRRLVSALVTANDRLGVTLETGTVVSSLKVDHGKITGVETSRGFVSTEAVVIAAGAWSSLIGASGDGLPNPRIKPVRGQMLCFDARPPLFNHVVYSPRGYVVPRRDGRLLSGSTTEHAGFDKHVTAAGVHSILSSAMEIAPKISSLPLTGSWAGLRPRASDTLPVLGPCDEIGGVFYATGHYRNGILLAPITGELVAAAILENQVSPLLDTFSPNRFALVSKD